MISLSPCLSPFVSFTNIPDLHFLIVLKALVERRGEDRGKGKGEGEERGRGDGEREREGKGKGEGEGEGKRRRRGTFQDLEQRTTMRSNGVSTPS